MGEKTDDTHFCPLFVLLQWYAAPEVFAFFFKTISLFYDLEKLLYT
jgi:hypothetical protein